MKNYVVVVGGINMDIKAKSASAFVLKDSNPGFIEFSPGGVGRNIAHNLALLGMPVKLLSAVGRDDEGSRVLRETAAAGVDIGHILYSDTHRTGTYIALLDPTGEMMAAVSSMDIFEQITPDYLQSKLEIIKCCSYIICDTNIPAASIQYLIGISKELDIPLCVEPVSTKKAAKVKSNLEGITLITPNCAELAELSGGIDSSLDVPTAAAALIKAGVKSVVTTLGEKGICYTDRSGSRFLGSYKVPVQDVTGAGDSLTAGLIYGLLSQADVESACAYGLAAAAVTIGSKETVSGELSLRQLQNIISNSPKNS